MSVSLTEAMAVDDGDEVARQRRKRASRLGLPGPADGDAEMRALRNRCLGAIEESGGTFDVRRFLIDGGHSWQTIETVLAHLQLGPRSHPSTDAPLSRIR